MPSRKRRIWIWKKLPFKALLIRLAWTKGKWPLVNIEPLVCFLWYSVVALDLHLYWMCFWCSPSYFKPDNVPCRQTLHWICFYVLLLVSGTWQHWSCWQKMTKTRCGWIWMNATYLTARLRRYWLKAGSFASAVGEALIAPSSQTAFHTYCSIFPPTFCR